MDSARCSLRRLRASTERASLVLVALGLAAAASVAAAQARDEPKAKDTPSEQAQPQSAGAAAPGAGAQSSAKGIAALEAFLDGVKSLSADFTQELYSADQRLLETDTGTLSLERPNRFRWTYEKPMQLVVVADGEKLWMYDVELAQVTVAPLGETVGSSPAMLLSGDRSVRDGFDVVQTDTLDGIDWVKLAPKAGAADFRSVRIGFAGKSPRQLELVDGLNQVTRIVLANVVVNPDLPAGAFEFHPPPGVDVIGGEG